MRGVICLCLLLASCGSYAQESFSISIVPVSISGCPAIHSFAFGQYNGKWIFIGGRTNGLHGFEPPFAFPSSGINDQIFVVDPALNASWSASIAGLPDSIREPLTTSNMEYYQSDTTLYMVGGYGWKNSVSDFRTFPVLTSVNLKSLAQDVIAGVPLGPSYFRQTYDTCMAVTGGNLHKLDSVYHLVFGHRFDGTYSLNDSTGGYFVQHYTYQVRTFTIDDQGALPVINNYGAQTDSANFRRRDFNLVQQIFPDGTLGLTAFTGVFRPGTRLPWLNTVDIKKGSYTVVNTFNQNLSQYQCATMPVYDSIFNAMHTVFFGGMSMYTLDTITQTLQADSLVPFVSTISRITRLANGSLQEYRLPVEMPGLQGTNTVFIPKPGLPMKGDILLLNKMSGKVHVGYLVGGIDSPKPNISEEDPSLSKASNLVFEVYLEKNPPTAISRDIRYGQNILDFYAYASAQGVKISYEAVENGTGTILILDPKGAHVATLFSGNMHAGKNSFTWDGKNAAAGLYYCRASLNGHSKTIKFSLGSKR